MLSTATDSGDSKCSSLGNVDGNIDSNNGNMDDCDDGNNIDVRVENKKGITLIGKLNAMTLALKSVLI